MIFSSHGKSFFKSLLDLTKRQKELLYRFEAMPFFFFF